MSTSFRVLLRSYWFESGTRWVLGTYTTLTTRDHFPWAPNLPLLRNLRLNWTPTQWRVSNNSERLQSSGVNPGRLGTVSFISPLRSRQVCAPINLFNRGETWGKTKIFLIRRLWSLTRSDFVRVKERGTIRDRSGRDFLKSYSLLSDKRLSQTQRTYGKTSREWGEWRCVLPPLTSVIDPSDDSTRVLPAIVFLR